MSNGTSKKQKKNPVSCILLIFQPVYEIQMMNNVTNTTHKKACFLSAFYMQNNGNERIHVQLIEKVPCYMYSAIHEKGFTYFYYRYNFKGGSNLPKPFRRPGINFTIDSMRYGLQTVFSILSIIPMVSG